MNEESQSSHCGDQGTDMHSSNMKQDGGGEIGLCDGSSTVDISWKAYNIRSNQIYDIILYYMFISLNGHYFTLHHYKFDLL